MTAQQMLGDVDAPRAWPRLRAQLERIARRFRLPRRISPTIAGLIALFAPLVLGFGAMNASNNLLFMLTGASLGMIVLSGILSERAIRGVSASIDPIGDVVAGEDTRLIVRLHREYGRATRDPVYGLRLRERMPRRTRKQTPPLDVMFASVEGRDGQAFGTRTFTRRGRVPLDACEIITTAPFGLLRKSRDVYTGCSVVVRPRRVDVPSALASPLGAAEGGEASRSRGFGQDIYGLRERQEWDTAHRVHALRSLALDRDVVLETEAMCKPTAWLAVANFEGADAVAFERTLEVAAATASGWARAGYAVGLRTASGVWAPDTFELASILDALALTELEAPRSQADDAGPLWLVPAGASAPTAATAIGRVDRQGAVAIDEKVGA